jgi:hypothetical protein
MKKQTAIMVTTYFQCMHESPSACDYFEINKSYPHNRYCKYRAGYSTCCTNRAAQAQFMWPVENTTPFRHGSDATRTPDKTSEVLR